jgi:glutamate--cysteine ligase
MLVIPGGSGLNEHARAGRGVPTRPVRAADVVEYVAERCLAPSGAGLVGVEVEWFPYRVENPADRVPIGAVQSALGPGPLPGGTPVTFEPGGQVELSGLAQPGAAAACAALQADLAVVRARLGASGIQLLGTGLHPQWEPRRVLSGPRYRAMEAYFDAVGPGRGEPSWGCAGRTMMTLTAAVQINVDLGPNPERAWNLTHDLGPVFVGAFANSPFARGRPTGFRSTRFANWWQLDPGRTRPIGAGGGAVPAIAGYALAAPVMGTFTDAGRTAFAPVLERMTFQQWIDRGYRGRHPEPADFTYHLTTLVPPIRPRGWLELRMVDALPGSAWQVPVALACALLARDHSADADLTAARGLWPDAAEYGPGHPAVALAARRAFALAAEVLDGCPSERHLADAVRDYAQRYVLRGRCPADDALDVWRRTGRVCAAGNQPASA